MENSQNGIIPEAIGAVIETVFTCGKAEILAPGAGFAAAAIEGVLCSDVSNRDELPYARARTQTRGMGKRFLRDVASLASAPISQPITISSSLAERRENFGVFYDIPAALKGD